MRYKIRNFQNCISDLVEGFPCLIRKEEYELFLYVLESISGCTEEGLIVSDKDKYYYIKLRVMR